MLDVWFHPEVVPRLRGAAFLVRFAHDSVIAFEREGDARRVRDVLPRRLGRYGLELHPEKTRLLDFRSPWTWGSEPGSFDLLGFTHYRGKSRRGAPVIQRKTCDQEDVVAPATRSEGALKKVSTRKTADGRPAHSFRTLITELGGIVRNLCRRKGADREEAVIAMHTKPTPLQQKALDLLDAISM